MKSFDINTVLLDGSKQFLQKRHGLFINNEWVAPKGGKDFDVVDPGTGKVLTKLAYAEQHDVDLAVEAARRAFDQGPWTRMLPAQRQQLIWRLADRLDQLKDEFAQLEALDTGKPISEASAVDIPFTVEQFRYMAGWATKISGQTLNVTSAPGDYHAYTLREPIGVVAQIVPWNFPLLLAAYKLAPALAAGCTMILKPAEQTSLTALRFAEIVREVGIPPGVVNVITGLGHVAGAALAEHPDVDKIAFTGSTEVGKAVVRAAASNLKKVTVELGGKSPVLVLSDADVDAAIAGAAGGIFFNQGQVCTAGSRIYVHAKVYDRFVEGLAAHAKSLRIGHGLDASTQLGPLVSQEQLSRVQQYVAGARAAGATVLSGGNRIDGSGYFMEPTVLTDTTADMAVVREEIFGPVACVMRHEDDDVEALARVANASQFGLAASIWTRDIKKAHLLAKRVRSGIVWLNTHNHFDPAFPVGGYKQSGWGRECGAEALSLYTELKSVMAPL